MISSYPQPYINEPRLRHLPLPLFAASMGLGGLGLAWREAATVLHAPTIIGETILALAGFVWSALAAFHALRALQFPDALRDDLAHPVRSAFAAAITVGLMILSGGLLPYDRAAAEFVWCLAVVAHLGVAVWIVRTLLMHPRDISSLMPPLLIPLVGNILAPIFGARLGHETLSWMLFGIGFLLWVTIQPPMLGRIIGGPAIPDRMKPTLAILVAPPAVGSLALASLTGSFGPAPLALLGLALILSAALASLMPTLLRIPFSVAWWAWTFPSAALTIASLKAAHSYPATWQPIALWLLLAGVTILIGFIFISTARAAISGHLFQPEPLPPPPTSKT